MVGWGWVGVTQGSSWPPMKKKKKNQILQFWYFQSQSQTWGAMVGWGRFGGDPRGQLTPRCKNKKNQIFESWYYQSQTQSGGPWFAEDGFGVTQGGNWPPMKKKKKIKIYNFDIFASESKLGGYGRLKMGWGWTKGGIWPPMKKRKQSNFTILIFSESESDLGGHGWLRAVWGWPKGGSWPPDEKNQIFQIWYFQVQVSSQVCSFRIHRHFGRGVPGGRSIGTSAILGILGLWYRCKCLEEYFTLHPSPMTSLPVWWRHHGKTANFVVDIGSCVSHGKGLGEASSVIPFWATPLQYKRATSRFVIFFLWTARMALNAGDDGRQCPGHTALEPSAKLRNSLEHLSRAWGRLLIFFGSAFGIQFAVDFPRVLLVYFKKRKLAGQYHILRNIYWRLL